MTKRQGEHNMLLTNTEVPLYEQLFILLRRVIEYGELHPGDKLPSERDLAYRHGISRDTVRKAVDLLEQSGYVHRHHGKGTLINTNDKS